MNLNITPGDSGVETQVFMAIKEQLLTLQFLAMSLRDTAAVAALNARIKKDLQEFGIRGTGHLDDEIIEVMKGSTDGIVLNDAGLKYHCEIVPTSNRRVISLREGIVGPADALIHHTQFISAAERCFQRTVDPLPV